MAHHHRTGGRIGFWGSEGGVVASVWLGCGKGFRGRASWMRKNNQTGQSGENMQASP